MSRAWAGAGLLAVILAVAGCGPGHSHTLASSPTAKADTALAVHKATLTLDYCLPPGTVAQSTALATITQPKVIDAFLHHSTRKTVEECWYAHGVRHGVGACVLSQVAQAPSDLASPSGRAALGQAIFTGCLVSSQ